MFPRFSIFPSPSRVPVRHFFRIPLCSRVPVSRSYAPVSKSVCVGGGGATHQSRTACVWMDQAGGVNSPLTPPRHACAVYEYTSGKPDWGQTHISSTPPSTSPLSTRHNFVISSQEREFSVPILSRSCIKFAFPRARVPKIPGTRERAPFADFSPPPLPPRTEHCLQLIVVY